MFERMVKTLKRSGIEVFGNESYDRLASLLEEHFIDCAGFDRLHNWNYHTAMSSVKSMSLSQICDEFDLNLKRHYRIAA